MREIEFRGKHDKRYCKEDEWIYGVPYVDYEGDTIMTGSGYKRVVDSETVGQYIGKSDKTKKKIFEGDIVKFKDELYQIKYLEEYMRFAAVNAGCVFTVFNFPSCKVVGNIFDNPELVEVLNEKRK